MKKKLNSLRQAMFLSLILLTACSNTKEQPESLSIVSRIEETEEEAERKEEAGEDKKEKNTVNEPVPDQISQAAGQPKVQVAAEDFSRSPEAMTQEAAPASANTVGLQDDRIQDIRDIYNRTVNSQDSYYQSGGCYYTAGGVLAKAVVSNGTAVLDEAMRKNGYTSYSLEYYYEDWAGGDGYPIFIYAVIDKKEYRYYFFQGEFIRRVGPEGGGNTNDSPEMNTFIQTLRDEGASYRARSMETGQATAASGTGSETGTAGRGWSREEKIAYIDSFYEKITGNPELYIPSDSGWIYKDGNNGVLKAVLSNGYPILDEAMRKNGYSEYVLECYYAIDDNAGNEEDAAMLVHAWIDGKEYWYYFFNNEFIRRVGPEGGGNRNDAPKTNSFIETLRDECGKHCVICGA